MGTTGSKSRGLWPFASPAAGGGGAEGPGGQQALARARAARAATPFVFTRRGSMYYDEDGDLAHEFYEETIVTKNGRKRAKLKRIHKNLIPQPLADILMGNWNCRQAALWELVKGERACTSHQRIFPASQVC
ncbi:tumor suppressor candidate 2 isoform X2 [Heliangelus exortis]|uniref:tumor suppressor candidate 2 isoform X2 n=1 Tax=Heliangelus exortis TaxID=472823 RepID=UPI003A933C0C